MPKFADITYTICGNEADISDSVWNRVVGNTVATVDGKPKPVQSYTGPGHPDHGNCSGDYYWSWNLYYHRAVWRWSNATLPNSTCRAFIYIPAWYAGVHDAQYSPSVQPGSYSFADSLTR